MKIVDDDNSDVVSEFLEQVASCRTIEDLQCLKEITIGTVKGSRDEINEILKLFASIIESTAILRFGGHWTVLNPEPSAVLIDRVAKSTISHRH